MPKKKKPTKKPTTPEIDEQLQEAMEIVEKNKQRKESVEKATKEIEAICKKYNVALHVQQPQVQVVSLL